MFKKFLNDERGAEMTEYILIIALVAIAVIGAVAAFRDKIVAAFKQAGDQIEKAAGGGG